MIKIDHTKVIIDITKSDYSCELKYRELLAEVFRKRIEGLKVPNRRSARKKEAVCGVLVPAQFEPESEANIASSCYNHSRPKLGRVHGCVPTGRLNGWGKVLLLISTCCLPFALASCGGSITVNGTSTGALVASPNKITFGSVPIGQTASTTVSLLNKSSAPVQIAQLNLSGQPFSLVGSGSLPVRIAAGATHTLNVQFNPAALGTATGQLTIASNSSTADTSVINLSGTGTTGASSAALSALYCSSGAMTGLGTDACVVTLSSAAPVGGLAVSLASSSSSVTIPKMVIVSANAIGAEFTATVSSEATPQVVTITASAGGVLRTFALQLNATILALTINATSVAFGDVAVNTSATQSVTLTSTGTAAVTISGATLTGAGFKLLGATFPTTLDPGQETVVNIGFEPTVVGAATGQIIVTSNDSTNGTDVISLSGTSLPAITLTLSNSTVGSGATLTGSITLSQASANTINVNLVSSLSGHVSVTPSILIVPAGQTSATFSYTGTAIGTSTLSASAIGYSPASAQVTTAIPVIPTSLFGLTVLNFESFVPTLSFGTSRSWSAWPGLDWAEINPSPGVYNFAYLDKFIAINQARGTDIIFTLNRTPQWASSQPNTDSNFGRGQCAPPADMSYYDNYLTAIATRAAGKIKYWEIWNEPESVISYCGDIPTMVTMAQHASRIIKGIDPNALILSPAANGPAGPAWLASFLAAGGSEYVDIIAFHGYSSAQAEDIIGVISKFKAAMLANGAEGKPMWDTESSWAGFGDRPTPAISQQVGFIAKDYMLHWSQGVSRFVWYAYDDTIWGGLFNSTTGETAAATSYNQIYKWLVGASLTAPCSKSDASVWTCTLSRPGGYTGLVVWTSNSSASFTTPPQYILYRDLSGAVYPVTNHTMTISDQPILLETEDIPL